MISQYRRFTTLDRSQRRLVLEAAMLMVFARAGLRLLRFLTLRRILDRSVVLLTPAEVGMAHPDAIESVRWAVSAVSRHYPSATCLVQALAADAMLRRRGLASEIRFGVRVHSDTVPRIEGHAWVACAGGVTIGATEQPEFKVLTR